MNTWLYTNELYLSIVAGITPYPSLVTMPSEHDIPYQSTIFTNSCHEGQGIGY